MAFRVKISPPIRVTTRDLERRRQSYSEYAGAHTQVEVCDLPEGPEMLYTRGDRLRCEYEVFCEGARTTAEETDAILVDCIFDPAVDAIREETGLPTFGPLKCTLSLVSLVSPTFAIIAAIDQHRADLIDLVTQYGYAGALVAVRSLGATYPRYRDYEAVVQHQVRLAIEKDQAQAIVMGSTTMALTDEIRAVAGNTPVFLPGMITLGIMQSLWRDRILDRRKT